MENSALQTEDVLAWVQSNDRSIHGTTWGDLDGFQGVSRMSLGRVVSRADLEADWTMTHELVHLAIASLADEHHWLEEGLATYVEPIARSQDGQLSAAKVWESMISGMAEGEPRRGDHGLDKSHTWGRTYWGGAMFCLVADVEIRRATANRKGLQDALRAIVAAGTTIDAESEPLPILHMGDQATGTTVLSDLYQRWKDAPVKVNLDQLWRELGVRIGPPGMELDSDAPLAEIRSAITSRPSH